MQIKYALIAFPCIGKFPALTQDQDLGFSTVMLKNPSTVLSTIPEKPWKGWLGSIAWEELFKAEHVVINYCPTSTPEDLDGENIKLTTHLSEVVYKSLMLVAPFCGSHGSIRLLTGKGVFENGQIQIENLRSHTLISEWVLPGFRFNSQYWSWMEETYTEKTVISDWKHQIDKLNSIGNEGTKYLYRLSLEIFRRGLSEKWADIVFPHVVRSAETLIALPKQSVLMKMYGHGSAKEFATRTLKHYPASSNLLYNLNAKDLQDLFEDIYQLRSDSVHGKPLAWTLKQKSPRLTDDDLQKLEFISEMGTRSILRAAIANQTWINAVDDRADLERAWLSNLI
jgi:hypothetical protein